MYSVLSMSGQIKTLPTELVVPPMSFFAFYADRYTAPIL